MPHATNSDYLERLTTLNHRHVPSSLSTNSELIEAIKDQSLSMDQLHLQLPIHKRRGAANEDDLGSRP